MEDSIYKNAFKEVYDILENTDEELLKKIPTKFMKFIKDNMNVDYETNIKKDVEIDKQDLLKETESVLALIYRSYWATSEEKQEFARKSKTETIEAEKRKKEEFKGKSIDEIFNRKVNIDKIIINNNLMVIQKESFVKRILNKLVKIFKK
jgi:hypothetical protein